VPHYIKKCIDDVIKRFKYFFFPANYYSRVLTEVMKLWYQLYCEKERLVNDQFDQLKTLVDIGDILGASGSVKRTEKGKCNMVS
jgi:lysyl-tRNA synthetase class II